MLKINRFQKLTKNKEIQVNSISGKVEGNIGKTLMRRYPETVLTVM